MKSHHSVAGLLIGALLAGCATELDVQPLASGDVPQRGITYVLPYTQFTVTATWRIADCQNGRVALKVDAQPVEAEDGNHAYLIDPTSLQSALSISEFDASFHEGSLMLSAVNAEVEDRTGPFIGNIVKTVAALAPVRVTRVLAEREPACLPDIRDAFEQSARLKSALDDATASLTLATDEVARLAALLARLGNAAGPTTEAEFNEAVRRLAEIAAAHAALSARYSGSLTPITHRQIIRWPENSDCFQSEQFSVAPTVLAAWFGSGDAQVSPLYLAIERAGSFGRDPVSAPTCPAANATPATPEPAAGEEVEQPDSDAPDPSGLRYRAPIMGRLVACTSSNCTSTAPDKVIFEMRTPIAQLGRLNFLPVRTRPFGSTRFRAQFRRDGGLASAGYEQMSAPLEGLSAAVASAAGELAPILDPTQRLARETAYLEALKARRDAAAALEPAAQDSGDDARAVLAALEADTTVLNAQIANLEAQIALRELQSRAAGD